MAEGSVRTPTRTPHSRSRSILGEISLTASQLNVPSPVPSDKYRATATAANRLIDFSRGSPRNSIHRRSLSTTSGPRHNRHLSKAAGYRFLQRAASSDDEPTSDSGSVIPTSIRLDLGDAEHPIVHFRPQLWRHLDKARDILNLDLFWPQRLHLLAENDEEEEGEENQYDRNSFPLEGLLPLCEFRNLRSLRLGGMLQSYQTYIWRACWLNPGLEELILEMALEPTINQMNSSYTLIEGSWCQKSISEACTGYLGELGDGSLDASIGTGEYLDKNAMATARNLVSSQGVNLRYLPVVKLVLAGFVVDAGPFFRWFNPMRLRCVEFKYGCIDAGFALPSHMNNLVTVSWLGKLDLNTQAVTVSKVRPPDIKTVCIKRRPLMARQTSGFKPKINSILTKNWFSSARAHSLKARKSNKQRLQRANQISGASSSSDLSSFRQRSSSDVSFTSQEFVNLGKDER